MDFHFLTVEARDDRGKGNRNTVELLIDVRDVNDNPPRFDKRFYEFNIPENSREFPQLSVVHAEDKDQNGTRNSEVRYQVISGSENFTIDGPSGKLSPLGNIDYEAIDDQDEDGNKFIPIIVRAYDLGVPSLFNDVGVIVYVVDENDHSPEFVEDVYLVAIPENVSPDSVVVAVEAYDADGSKPNNDIYFRIKSGAKDKFVIDPTTGDIRAKLDPELESTMISHILEVEALDGGIGKNRLSGTTIVNITILDVNNKNPYFIHHPDPIVIPEDANVDDFIVSVDARDPDSSSNLEFTLNFNKSIARTSQGTTIIDSGNLLKEAFVINKRSGSINVSGSLDREIFETANLFVEVEDLNADRDLQMTSTTITIIIDDVNDNSPKFKAFSYSGSVPENSKLGYNVITVEALDPDKNNSVIYEMETIPVALTVDIESGDVLVSGPIDYETIQWINFTVVATDSGFPSRSGFADVSIKVLDMNDNSPTFKGSEVIEVLEDVIPGTVIGKVTAFDADSGVYGRITYFLDKPFGKPFSVDPDTGQLTVLENLDREQQSSYSIIIQAYDNYQFGFTTGDSRNGFTQVLIRVLDVNDEKPIFENDTLNDNDCAVITEFHPTSKAVVDIRAVDDDDGRLPNGKIDFEIEGGNEDGLFRLHSDESGSGVAKVFPERSLKGFYGNYTLQIKAKDRGIPENVAFGSYSICVQDFNDNTPEFVSENFTVRVPENATVGSEVVRVRATDTDIGSNGEVRYEIRRDLTGNFKKFNIDPITGMIKVADPLDREQQAVYVLRIKAYDLGIPTALSSDMDLTIYVTNVNDNKPQFLEDLFVANFTEHRALGLERVRLPLTVDGDDEDPSEQRGVCYFIVGGDDDDNAFSLHPTTHDLITSKILDRELKSTYDLVVRATDR